MFNSLDYVSTSDSDTLLQSDHHQREAVALLNGEISETSFGFGFDMSIQSRFAH